MDSLRFLCSVSLMFWTYFDKSMGLSASVSFYPLPLFLALTPFFAQSKHRKSHSSDFLCFPTAWKHLLCRLLHLLMGLFLQTKYRMPIHHICFVKFIIVMRDNANFETNQFCLGFIKFKFDIRHDFLNLIFCS